MKCYGVRITNSDWMTDDIFLCNEEQLPVIESLGFYTETRELKDEEYKKFEAKLKYESYEDFVHSFRRYVAKDPNVLKELTREKYEEVKEQKRYRSYESFLKSFGSNPWVKIKLREIEEQTK